MEVTQTVAFSKGMGTDFGQGFSTVIPRRLNTTNNGIVKFAQGSEGGPLDTLQALRVANQLTLAQYGVDLAWQQFEVLMQAYNGIVGDMLGNLGMADITTDRQRAYGSVTTMSMEKLDVNGVPRPQKVQGGVTTGAPLERFGAGLNWNWDFYNQATPAELAAQFQALITADTAMIIRNIKRAMFGVTNTTSYTFVDDLVDGVNLYVKYLATSNANDGFYPVGQNGVTFATSHAHYSGVGTSWATASAAARSADVVTYLSNNVKEHVNDGTVRIYINYADAKYWTGDGTISVMTGFVPLQYQGIIPSISSDNAGMGRRPGVPIYDVLIGFFQGCEVWIKPFGIANYAIAHAVGPNVPPTLWIRVPESPKVPSGASVSSVAGATSLGSGDLRLVQSMPGAPFICQAAERRFGVGIWNRVGMAVLDFITAGSTYTVPTIT